jgi:type IV pilus assembly protein PilW
MMMRKEFTKRASKTQLGVTLVELMVALAIGSLLMIGAVSVYMQSRTAFTVSESVSRLQENARYAFEILEPDIRMAHYWGLTARTNRMQGRATPLDPIPPGLGVAGDCAQNWAINLDEEVGGDNNGYAWPACAPFLNAPTPPTSDTLVIRRVSEDPLLILQPGVIYVQSGRFRDGQLFTGTIVPPGFVPAQSATHTLIVNGFYVSSTSTLSTPGNLIPSLRSKGLVGGFGAGGAPTIADFEIIPGVEDMQIQFGVDTDITGALTRGSVNLFVNPGANIITPGAAGFLPQAEILAVRIWLRLRAERPELGFQDTNTYVYADQNVPAPMDGFRRTVVSKTIYLRNARTGIQ